MASNEGNGSAIDASERSMVVMSQVNELNQDASVIDVTGDKMVKTMAANDETNDQCLSPEEMAAQIDVVVDTTYHFRTYMVFESKDVVLDWARRTGRVNDVVVVMLRSDLNDLNKKSRVILGCERSGTYTATYFFKKLSLSNKSSRRSSTKKCGCPFRLRAQATDSSLKQWSLYVTNGAHNHILARAAEGLVEKLGKTGVKSKEMLHQIKLADPTNASTLKTIYNVRSQLHINEMAGNN